MSDSSFEKRSSADKKPEVYIYRNKMESEAGSKIVSISLNRYFHNAYTIYLFILGGISLLSFFILLLYIRNREILYLYYFLFMIFSILGIVINLTGYNSDTKVFTRISSLAQRNVEVVTLFGLFAYCLFTLKLLNVKKQAPKLAGWITVLAAITAIYGSIYWFIYPLIKENEVSFFIFSRSIILPMALVAIFWVTYRVRSVFKSYFIIGSLFYFVGAFLAVLRETLPTIPFENFYNISSNSYFYSGIFLEVVCFALALSHRIYLLFQTRQKQEKSLRERVIHERDLARAKVLSGNLRANPHFIFNSLNTIKYLIQKDEKGKAMKSLIMYSRFLRMILDTGSKTMHTLTTEFSMVQYYLRLESGRYEVDFYCNIDLQSNVLTDEILLPPMMLLPFIEDIIWQSRGEDVILDKEIKIQVKKEEEHIHIIIENMSETSQSFPLNNTPKEVFFKKEQRETVNDERIALYNRNNIAHIKCYKCLHKDKKGRILGTQVTIILDPSPE